MPDRLYLPHYDQQYANGSFADTDYVFVIDWKLINWTHHYSKKRYKSINNYKKLNYGKAKGRVGGRYRRKTKDMKHYQRNFKCKRF